MLASPSSRKMVMTMLRKDAITPGALPRLLDTVQEWLEVADLVVVLGHVLLH